jgi:hypothetical protein
VFGGDFSIELLAGFFKPFAPIHFRQYPFEGDYLLRKHIHILSRFSAVKEAAERFALLAGGAIIRIVLKITRIIFTRFASREARPLHALFGVCVLNALAKFPTIAQRATSLTGFNP